MGIFDFLKPKRKKDEFDEFRAPDSMGEFGSPEFGTAPMPRQRPMQRSAPPMDMGLPSMPQQQPPGGFPRGGANLSQDIQTLSYKLDSLKSSLDNISARLSTIESALRTQPIQEKPEAGWTY